MKKLFYSVGAVIANFFLLYAAHAVTISMNIPGTSPNASTTPGAFVANFYQFALMIGGVLAFGVVVYGGVRYMASAGNPSGQSDAREWIEAALLGLLLLVGAYFVLNVVNPQLTTLGLPPLQTVNIQTPAAATSAMMSAPVPVSAIQSVVPTTCVPACTPPAYCAIQNMSGAPGLQGISTVDLDPATAVYSCQVGTNPLAPPSGPAPIPSLSGGCQPNPCQSGQTCSEVGTGHLCM
jgi:hypothetical protein